MKCVPITIMPGHLAWVDEQDVELVEDYNWWLSLGYAATQFEDGCARIRLRMHRLIMSPKPGEHVDHINGNRLDNRRQNLRIASQSENSANRSAVCKSGYRGVYLNKEGVYESRLTVRPKCHYLGRFTDPMEAALAYDAAASKAFGEFARLNFPRAVNSIMRGDMSE